MTLLPTADRPVDGIVSVPGSKSIANRALVAAALAEGESTLTNVPAGDDTAAMLEGLGVLGVAIETGDDGTARIDGSGGRLVDHAVNVHARLAGTTSRFLTALAALASGPVTIDGDPPLRSRPMHHLHDALSVLGARIEHGEGAGRLPVTVTGPLRRGGTVTLPGDVSSQFVTALMLIAPLLDGGLRVELTSPLVSTPYVQMTARVMAHFGVGGVTVDDDLVLVPSGHYRAAELAVEADASSASYPLAIAAVRGGTVTVPGLPRASTQADIAFLDLLERMGCRVDGDDGSVTVRRDPDRPLSGVDVDLADSSDLVPTVAAIGVTASGPTTIRGVGFVRGKESDRLGDLAGELARLGAAVTETGDGLRIEPVAGGPSGLHGAELSTHHDHRLAMAFAVVASAVPGIAVDDPGVVTKSWPGFWEAYAALVGSR